MNPIRARKERRARRSGIVVDHSERDEAASQRMDFQKRLEKAVERGLRSGDAQAQARAQQALGLEELKRLHAQYRLELSDHIEACLSQLPQHFPGFRFETIVGDRGWGAGIGRDDLSLEAGKRLTYFSRLEVVIRPFSNLHVLELTAKGTIRNKEIYNRNSYQRLEEVDATSFKELTDLWVLEYAELYAAKT